MRMTSWLAVALLMGCSSTDDGAPGGGSVAVGSGGDPTSGSGAAGASSGTAAGGSGAASGSGGSGGDGGPRQNLLVETTAEGAGWSAGWDTVSQVNDNGYALEQSGERARVGASSIRFELRSSDPIVSSSVRTEMTQPDSGDTEQMERWYGLSYYLVDWGSDTGGESILQWHDVDGTCPPLAIQIYGAEMSLTRCIEGANSPYPIGVVQSNEWLDIVIRVVWRTDDSGHLQLWRNGTKVVDEPGIRTQSTGGSYLKVGMNKWSWAPGGGTSNQTERIFFIDEIRIGNENARLHDVTPGDY